MNNNDGDDDNNENEKHDTSSFITSDSSSNEYYDDEVNKEENEFEVSHPPHKKQRKEYQQIPPPLKSSYLEEEKKYVQSLDIESQWNIYEKEEYLYDDTKENSITPRRFRILCNDAIPFKVKQNILKTLDYFDPEKNSSENEKKRLYLERFELIPFNKYNELPLDVNNPLSVSTFLNTAKKDLDTQIYGHTKGKNQILKLFAQWISNPHDQRGSVIGIQGNPGVGKTTLVKDGICKLFNLPYTTLSLGGISDSSHFLGHSYTYLGSKHGSIVQGLMDMQVMNGCFHMDELDKVSNNENGNDIINTLICLTDPAQNTEFKDSYFNEIPIDISRCIFIFTYNYEENISPVLLDRMIIIRAEDYTRNDKINIGKDYLLPKIEKKFNVSIVPQSLHIEDDIASIVDLYVNSEPGVRNLQRALEHCVSEELTNTLLQYGFNDNSIPLKPHILKDWNTNKKSIIETNHMYL